ncbi:hypothetical protein [Bdellovibrio sp. HCB274]|uniref:hypothetical protein n=1 Tax=Bdellovibrio sp. HCB274 TaxID=3394361 RepID=UPI0039B43692
MKKILMLMIFALVGIVMSATPMVAHAQTTTNPGTDPADNMETGKSTDANVSAPGCTKCQMYQKQLRMKDATAAQPRSGSSSSGSNSGDAATRGGAQ